MTPPPQRRTYRIEKVRAADLTNQDVAIVGGRWWRQIADVHLDHQGDWTATRECYGSAVVNELIGKPGQDGPDGMVLVRYLLPRETNSGGIDDGFVLISQVELIDVQATC